MLTVDAMPDEPTCQCALIPACNRAGMMDAIHWPIGEGDALRLLRDGMEFTATPAVLARCEAMGWFTAPESGEWTARDVMLLAHHLDRLRFWKPSPSIHDAMRHPAAIAFDAAVRDGCIRETAETLQRDEGVDIRLTLIMMAEAETRVAREGLLYAAFALLAARGVVI